MKGQAGRSLLNLWHIGELSTGPKDQLWTVSKVFFSKLHHWDGLRGGNNLLRVLKCNVSRKAEGTMQGRDSVISSSERQGGPC